MDTYLILQYDNRPVSKYKELIKLNKQYCKRHNYEYKFIYKTYNLPPYWIKVYLLDKLLPNYKGILWLDTDACIYNIDIQLEDIIIKDKHFYGSPDNKVWNSPFNAGIFFVLNTKIGLEIINNWLNTYDKKMWEKQDKKWISSCKWASECYEQGSFIKNILPNYTKYIHFFHWRFFNSFYSNLEENNNVFILHFAGDFKKEIPLFLKNKSKRNKSIFLKTRKIKS
jgi:hypothetical protein